MIFTQKTYAGVIKKTFLLTALIICTSACIKDDTKPPSETNKADWKESSTVGVSEGSSVIIISGVMGTEWNSEITEGQTWCSFSRTDFGGSSVKKGTVEVGLNTLYVYYKANADKKERIAKISFQFAGKEVQILELKQLSKSQENLPSFNWPEMPISKEDANYQYVTHSITLNNKNMRNYSICFDKSKKASLWVAYPLHNVYIGGVKRSEAWTFDPIVLPEFQPDCRNRSYEGTYDRGHQIPSMDRTATEEMNQQTFYMSNITPQLDRLNQDMWEQLEKKVQVNRCSDTLYVVTGAFFGNTTKTARDGTRNTIVPVPTHYFKVLLRTKSGNTGKKIMDCQDNELISIGFWAEHKNYGDIPPPRSICMPVSEIESKTGFTFFPTVSTKVKQQNNPSDWSIN